MPRSCPLLPLLGPLALPLAALTAQPPAVPARDSLVRAPGMLAGVVVVGTAERARRGIAGAAAVVDSARLARLAPMSVREALRKVPGLHVVDEDAFGLNLNVGMRGLTARRAQRVLLLEDGMPIHLGPYSDPSAHYHPPVDALARIEVVKGASQVAFGPQTVGGVVNLVRRAPPDVPAARIALGGGSAGYATGRLSAGGRWDGRGLLLDVGRREGDGTRRGHHHRVDDVALRADVPLAGTQRLALSLGHYREASRYGEAGLSQVEFERDPYGNPLPHDVFDLTRQGAQLVHETTPRPGVRLRTQAYAQRVARTAWRQASTSRDRPGNAAWERAFGCPAGITSVDACGNTGRPRRYAFAGLEPRLSVAHALLGAEGALEAGVRAHAEHMRRQERAGATATARTGPLTRDNAVTTRAASLFVQERLRVGAWTLVPGVRLEHVRSRNHNVLASTRGHDAYTELLPGLGATWAPSSGRADGTTLFAGVHRGFAPPRPADVLDPQPGQGIVQVDAEHSWTSELGARARLGRWGQVEATAFRLDFANQIVRGSLVGAGQRYVNAGRTRHQGVELAGSVALDRAAEGAWPAAAGALALDVSWAWLPVARFASARASTADPTRSVLGRRVPFAPRQVLSAGLDWTHARGIGVRVDGDLTGAQFADDLETVAPTADGLRGVIPRWAVVHVAARAPVGGGRGAPVLVAAVKNVADRAYITDRQEGIMTGLPRRLTLGVEWGR